MRVKRDPCGGCYVAAILSGDEFLPDSGGTLVIAVPVFQVTLAVVLALFVIQMVKRLTAQSQNPIAVGANDALGFLTA
jgi:hypothetical protein